MGLSDVLSGRLPLKCGSTPAECGSESGKVRSKVRVSAVLAPAYTIALALLDIGLLHEAFCYVFIISYLFAVFKRKMKPFC